MSSVDAVQKTSAPAPQVSHWKQTILAAMTNYIDAGSIVAGAAGLSLWKDHFNISDTGLGLLGAFSSNAGSAAVGAILGGWICDKLGRKFVYTYDLLVYMIGILFIIFAQNFAMLFCGYTIVGLAVGAGITASWTLIAEQAPAEKRARHCGAAQVAWALGPMFVLILSVPLGKYGLLGNRIVFGHLFLVALITWILRFRMPESESWKENKEREKALRESGQLEKINLFTFLRGVNFRTLLFLTGVYAIWNLAAGTVGFYMQYVCVKVFDQSNQMANTILSVYFGVTVLATFFIFMGLGDRVSRRFLYGFLGLVGVAAWVLLLYAGYYQLSSIWILIGFVVLFGINNGSCQQPFYQLWCSELYPVRYRAFAQGITFFIARIILSLWNVCFAKIQGMEEMTVSLPGGSQIQVTGFVIAVAIMVGFTAFSMLVGTIFAPNTAGKTLEEIEIERYGKLGQ